MLLRLKKIGHPIFLICNWRSISLQRCKVNCQNLGLLKVAIIRSQNSPIDLYCQFQLSKLDKNKGQIEFLQPIPFTHFAYPFVNAYFKQMIINFISGPRNISTALMYSFSERNDTKVIDEPFYAFYLKKTELDHPGKEEIVATMKSDPSEIIESIRELESKHELVFLKNMAHHHIGLDWNYLNEMKNVLLIRDPKQLIASFSQVIPNPTLQDIGLKHEADLFDYIQENGKHKPIVIDSNHILSNPQKGLNRLCDQLGIPFSMNMLSWKKGAIQEDGIWAKYWYKNVHSSTGFAKQKTSERPLPEHCKVLYQEALPYYEKLMNNR